MPTWKVVITTALPYDETKRKKIFSTTISGVDGPDLEKRVLNLIGANLVMLEDKRLGNRFDKPDDAVSTQIVINYIPEH
jgi:hypothetical protein